MSKKTVGQKRHSSKTRRAEPRVTLADVARKKLAERAAAAAAKTAAYDCHPNLERALRIKADAALLVIAVRDIVAPGPDGGGLDRAVGQVAHVSKRLEQMAEELERDVAQAVAS